MVLQFYYWAYIWRENHNLKRHLHPNVHGRLFTMVKTWKQAKYLHTQWTITQTNF